MGDIQLAAVNCVIQVGSGVAAIVYLRVNMQCTFTVFVTPYINPTQRLAAPPACVTIVLVGDVQQNVPSSDDGCTKHSVNQ